MKQENDHLLSSKYMSNIIYLALSRESDDLADAILFMQCATYIISRHHRDWTLIVFMWSSARSNLDKCHGVKNNTWSIVRYLRLINKLAKYYSN